MIAAPSITLASISGASERKSTCERQDKVSNFFFNNLDDPFLIVVVVLLNVHGQRMCQGYHLESD